MKNDFLAPSFMTLKMRTLALLCCLIFIAKTARTQNFPAGFSQVKVGTVYYPTSMAFAPDGRIFVTEKSGNVKIVKNGVVLSTPFLHVNVDQLNERGLSSVCIDPNFNSNHYVYIYYTTASSPIHNRLSRVTANGDVMLAGSEHVILDFEPCVNSIHNSGGMVFGNDGKLFLCVGNDNVNSNSQDLSNYKGKILRINSDGSVPSGNPFSGSASASRIWAYGLRNPWTIALQPGTGKLFVNDVGEGAWEEIDNATVAGRNFGWPATEGATSNPAYTTPVYTYHHGSPGTTLGCAITGGAFFNPATTNYPSTYIGKYFFIDYCNHWINYIDPSTGARSDFATNLGGALNYIKVGNDGNLYYFSISSNALYKIVHSNTNSPTITTQPASQTVSAGSNVTFTVTASGATPLSYQWRKNSANISGANSSSYSITNVNSGHAGQYSCVVSNSYGTATSNQATLTVTAYNGKPVATINTPSNGAIYRGGDVVSFSGSGTDPEDGTLPASAFYWYVEFHHDAHIHPGPYIPTGVTSGSFSISRTGEQSANVYFRLFLVVTDAQGAKDTASVDILPKKSTLTLATSPTGLKITLDGQPETAPFSILSVSGNDRTIGVVSPQTVGSTTYTFDHWSQGGAATQTVRITDNNITYTAVFSGAPATGCTATGTITRDVWTPMTGTSISDVPVNTTPTSTSSITSFEGPQNAGDYYGSRIRGYICPPTTGNYIFWIASDNGSELWLSTNDLPANKVKIATNPSYTAFRQWTKYPSQQSAAIHLNAGTRYYIEAIHREGTQGDHLSVGWQLPGGALERPIPGSRLSPFTSTGGTGGGSTPTCTITSPTNGQTFGTPSNININANASVSGGSITKVEFFNGATKLGEDLSAPYSYLWMNVTTGTYYIHAKATSNTGTTGTSANVTVKVASCATPVITASGPTKMCSGTVKLNTAVVSGGSYQWIRNGANISGATGSSYIAGVSGDYQVKVIQGSCISWSAPTKVTIGSSALSAQITPGGPTTFCSGGSVNLYANTCSGYTYQWIRGGTNITGATGAVYKATVGGSYQLRVTLSGASAWSSLLTVTVNACHEADSTGTDGDGETRALETEAAADSTKPFEMKVFPNPNNGQFTISLNMPTTKEEKVKMRMVNLLGQEVYNKEIVAGGDMLRETVELDGSLTTGIYTLQVIIGNRVESINVVLSR